MKNRITSMALGLVAASALVGAATLGGAGAYAGVLQQAGATPSATTTFADPAFQRVWERTDRPVAFGQVGRSWFWGPTPRTVVQEAFAEGVNGQHKVQYFDKSRMEINDPNGDPTSVFYVTNGLLTVELISGRMQMGVSSFQDLYPANIGIAGDNDDANAPTYASFRSVANVAAGVGRRDQNRMGQPVIATIDRAGTVGSDSTKTGVDGVNVAYYEATTGHNIPAKFWNFLNQSGQVYKDGQLVTEQLITPWYYASGLPVSDAYWAKVKIAGQTTDVLIQTFERRVLTYVPSNAPAFQVEMGNIGLHYFDWRYNGAGKPANLPSATTTAGASSTAVASGTTTVTAVATGTPGTAVATGTTTVVASPSTTPAATNTPSPLTGKVAFVSERSGNPDIWLMNADGLVPQNMTNNPASDVDPIWSPDGSKLAFASNRVNSTYQIFVIDMASALTATQVTTGTFEARQPTWSPDGSKLAFRGNQLGHNDIFTINASGTNMVNITQRPGNDRDPSWSSTNKIAFTSDFSGEDHIYIRQPDGTAEQKLTTVGPKNFTPMWSPDGRKILFISERPGAANQEVWVMDGDGAKPIRLTDASSAEWDPSWSPDGTRIIFASDRDGNLEVYNASIDAPNDTVISAITRLTMDPAKDYRPVWKK